MWRRIKGLFGGGNGDQLASDGAAAYMDGRYSEAIEKLIRAVELGFRIHSRDKILTILGNAYCEVGEHEKAIDAHQRAIELNPGNHQAWVNLGICQRRKGSPKEAADCYERAIELKPDYAEAHSSLGAMYIFLDLPAKAVLTLEHAKKLDPSLAVTHGNLALALGMSGQFSEADSVLKHAVALGYKNWREVRDRLEFLKTLGEGHSENEDEYQDFEEESSSGPRWSPLEVGVMNDEADEGGDSHEVCSSCGGKVPVEKQHCPHCGGSMSRFSAN